MLATPRDASSRPSPLRSTHSHLPPNEPSARLMMSVLYYPGEAAANGAYSASAPRPPNASSSPVASFARVLESRGTGGPPERTRAPRIPHHTYTHAIARAVKTMENSVAKMWRAGEDHSRSFFLHHFSASRFRLILSARDDLLSCNFLRVYLDFAELFLQHLFPIARSSLACDTRPLCCDPHAVSSLHSPLM